MKKVARPATPPVVTKAIDLPPPSIDIDIDAILARQAAALTAHTEAIVNAVRTEMRELTTMVVNAREGQVKVEIERDRSGNMKYLVIERIKTQLRSIN